MGGERGEEIRKRAQGGKKREKMGEGGGEGRRGRGKGGGGRQEPHSLSITEAPALVGPKAPSSGSAAEALREPSPGQALPWPSCPTPGGLHPGLGGGTHWSSRLRAAADC